ncbi:MAG: hypothetical protein AUI14_21485 [Actinobacteria bacterium 13_2_20CM_2_71_6]|nr:MAG: hypothetical protein AUI14_21485 [Actinobacteria bacterium 13_2_20CM_2_71_6]
MADVTIERLHITVELDGEGADEHFQRLFERHIDRWWECERARQSDRHFAEHERLLPDSLPGSPGGAP